MENSIHFSDLMGLFGNAPLAAVVYILWQRYQAVQEEYRDFLRNQVDLLQRAALKAGVNDEQNA